MFLGWKKCPEFKFWVKKALKLDAAAITQRYTAWQQKTAFMPKLPRNSDIGFLMLLIIMESLLNLLTQPLPRWRNVISSGSASLYCHKSSNNWSYLTKISDMGFSMLLIIMKSLLNLLIQLLPRWCNVINSGSARIYCYKCTTYLSFLTTLQTQGFRCRWSSWNR